MRPIVAIGETMGLFRASAPGGLEQVSDFVLGVGGAESNVAIGVARLGGAAAWIGRIGDDSLGRRVLRELRAEGVLLDGARLDEHAQTGIMVKESRMGGSTRVTYYRALSAGSRLTPDDLDEELIAGAAVLHVTGITPALSPSAAAAIEAAIAIAEQAAVPISFDVNHRGSLWRERDPRSIYLPLAHRATVIFAGAEEAALLVGPGSPPELAMRLAALGPTDAVVKLGEHGCVASIESELHSASAINVRVIDTVGAGDAFVAGYLTGLTEGMTPDARLGLAVRCGSFACLGAGDWESYPRRTDLTLLEGSRDPVIR